MSTPNTQVKIHQANQVASNLLEVLFQQQVQMKKKTKYQGMKYSKMNQLLIK